MDNILKLFPFANLTAPKMYPLTPPGEVSFLTFGLGELLIKAIFPLNGTFIQIVDFSYVYQISTPMQNSARGRYFYIFNLPFKYEK